MDMADALPHPLYERGGDTRKTLHIWRYGEYQVTFSVHASSYGLPPYILQEAVVEPEGTTLSEEMVICLVRDALERTEALMY